MTKFQRDLVERVLRTALQAALAVVAVELADPNFTIDSLQAVGVSAVAAAVSAAMNIAGHYVGNRDSGSWEA